MTGRLIVRTIILRFAMLVVAGFLSSIGILLGSALSGGGDNGSGNLSGAPAAAIFLACFAIADFLGGLVLSDRGNVDRLLVAKAWAIASAAVYAVGMVFALPLLSALGLLVVATGAAWMGAGSAERIAAQVAREQAERAAREEAEREAAEDDEGIDPTVGRSASPFGDPEDADADVFGEDSSGAGDSNPERS